MAIVLKWTWKGLINSVILPIKYSYLGISHTRWKPTPSLSILGYGGK